MNRGPFISNAVGAMADAQSQCRRLDAPLVVLGEMSPIYFQPDPSTGLHVSLLNNVWGTNYVQGFGEDMRFRFRIIKTAAAA